MRNRHTRSHLKKVFRIVRHSELSAYVQPSRNTGNIPQDLIKIFVEKGYNESTVRKQIERVDHLDRSFLLRNYKLKRKDSIQFSLRYNSVLPNIKKIINKHWHILNIDSSFKEIFNSSQLMIAFRKNISLKQLIGTNAIRNNQTILKPTQTTTAGQCAPCYTS